MIPPYTFKEVPDGAPSCGHCRHQVRETQGFWIFKEETYQCSHPAFVGTIDGKPVECQYARFNHPQRLCGVEGKGFEARVRSEPSIPPRPRR